MAERRAPSHSESICGPGSGTARRQTALRPVGTTGIGLAGRAATGRRGRARVRHRALNPELDAAVEKSARTPPASRVTSPTSRADGSTTRSAVRPRTGLLVRTRVSAPSRHLFGSGRSHRHFRPALSAHVRVLLFTCIRRCRCSTTGASVILPGSTAATSVAAESLAYTPRHQVRLPSFAPLGQRTQGPRHPVNAHRPWPHRTPGITGLAADHHQSSPLKGFRASQVPLCPMTPGVGRQRPLLSGLPTRQQLHHRRISTSTAA